MRCLSCQQEVLSTEACVVVEVYLCKSCGALAEKGVKELEKETARALELAKNTFAQHILRGGLLRNQKQTDFELVVGQPEVQESHEDAPTKKTKLPGGTHE